MQGQVIKDIKLHVDSLYVCILPIFAGDKILTDIICKKDNEYIFYNYNNRGVKNTWLIEI